MQRCKQKWEKEDDSVDKEGSPQDIHELYIINVGVDDDQKCRICLNEGEIPIFIGNVTVELCKWIFEIGGVEVSADDPYPKFLCLSCHALLRSAILFRKTAQLTDKVLKSQREEELEPTAGIYYHSDIDDTEDNASVSKHINSDHTYDNDPTYADDCTDDNDPTYKNDPTENDLSYENDPTYEIDPTHDNDPTYKNDPTENDPSYENDPTYEDDPTYENDQTYDSDDTYHTDTDVKPETASASVHTDREQQNNDVKTNSNTSSAQTAEHQNDHTNIVKLEITSVSVHTDQRRKNDGKTDKDTSLNPKTVTGQRFCKRCDLHFSTFKEYRAHIITPEHENKRIECKICKKSLSHHYFRKHPCVLPNDGQHRSKNDSKTVTRRGFCKRCDLHFSTFKEYRAHIMTPEHENKRIECKICKKSLSHHYFRKHPCVRNPAYVPRITDVCDICGKEFKAKSLYKRHRMIHFPERPFECTYCPYRGRFDQALKVHIRTHTGERPYQCTHCPSRFISKGALSKHLLTLKGQRDFSCDTCGRGFYLKRDLELHIKVDHIGIKEFSCEKCGKAFGYRHQMTKHNKRVHLKIKKK